MANILLKVFEILLVVVGIAIASTFLGIGCAFVCKLLFKDKSNNDPEGLMMKSCIVTVAIILTLMVIFEKK